MDHWTFRNPYAWDDKTEALDCRLKPPESKDGTHDWQIAANLSKALHVEASIMSHPTKFLLSRPVRVVILVVQTNL